MIKVLTCVTYHFFRRLGLTKSLFARQQRSLRSPTIRSKKFCELWWRPRTHQFTCRMILKKFVFFQFTMLDITWRTVLFFQQNYVFECPKLVFKAQEPHKMLFCITWDVNNMKKVPTVGLGSFWKNQLPLDVTQQKIIPHISIYGLSEK